MGRQSSSSSQPALLGPAFGQSSSPDIESGLTATSNSTSATGVYTSSSFLPRIASSVPEPNFDSDIEQTPVIELGEDEFQHPCSYLELPPHNQTFNPYEGLDSVYRQNQSHAFAQETYIPTNVSSNTTNANISLGLLSTANSGMGHSDMSGYSSIQQLGDVISTAYQTFSTGFGNTLGTIDMSSFDPSAGTMHQTANRISDTPNESSQPRNWGPTDSYADPQKKAQEIQGLLENIRPDVEILREDREGTPDGLKYPLYEHQKLALTWLKSMEEGTNKGGILADDMGLGKTITTLALILSRPSNDKVRKTTLIVGPVALVRQWAREIETKIKHSDRLSTFLYHTGKRVTWETLRSFDIVLTTYGKLGAEHKRKEEWEAKLIADPDMDQSGVHTMFPLLSDSAKWYRVILDEAQFIKNKATRAARGACELKSMTRICLTGTPMMNGVHELYSLVNFLRIKPYNEYRRFTDEFGYLFRNPTSGALCSRHQQESAMKKFQAVLKAILLRRTKKSKIDGQPILTLPEKTEVIVHGVFNEDEQDYYTSLEAGARLTFNKYLKAGTIGKNYSNILVLLLRLRQAACHPHLIMDFEEAPVEAPAADMEIWAKTLLPDVVRRILNATFPFECPVCYDPVPNPRFAIPCGHETCSECLVRITSNSQDEGIRGGTEAQNAKCPTCRGSIDIKRVIDYETFKKVHVADYAEEANVQNGDTLSEESWDDLDELSSTDETESEVDCGSEASDDMENFIVPDDYNSSDESGEGKDVDKDSNDKVNVKAKMNSTQPLKGKFFKSKTKEARVKFEDVEDSDDDNSFVEIKDIKGSRSTQLNGGKRSRSGVSLEKPKRSKSKSKKAKKHKSEDKVTSAKHTSLAQLKKEAMRNAEGRRRYMKYLRKNWVSSAKVDKCLEILKNTNPSTKTIVFSQFTTLLDLLEIPIRGEKWAFERYDGSMTAGARHNAVVKFTDDPECKIMLVSLKAGNAGLNLVAASQVIILDPFW
jgi:SNF2 family DNA or RNA helicase